MKRHCILSISALLIIMIVSCASQIKETQHAHSTRNSLSTSSGKASIILREDGTIEIKGVNIEIVGSGQVLLEGKPIALNPVEKASNNLTHEVKKMSKAEIQAELKRIAHGMGIKEGKFDFNSDKVVKKRIKSIDYHIPANAEEKTKGYAHILGGDLIRYNIPVENQSFGYDSPYRSNYCNVEILYGVLKDLSTNPDHYRNAMVRLNKGLSDIESVVTENYAILWLNEKNVDFKELCFMGWDKKNEKKLSIRIKRWHEGVSDQMTTESIIKLAEIICELPIAILNQKHK